MSIENTVQQFNQKVSHISALNGALGLIHWDGATGAPKASIDMRSRNIGILGGEAFKMSVDPAFKELVKEICDNKDEVDSVTYETARLYLKDIEKTEKIPPQEMQAYMELRSKSQQVWEEAREKDDFNLFAPYLKKVYEYAIKFAEYTGYKDHPYNAVLDMFEEGITVADLDAFFAELKETIVPLLKRIQKEGRTLRTDFLSRKYDIEAQKKLNMELLDLIGFDLNRGMMKESAHPFTLNLNVNDVRLTTRYIEDQMASAIFSTFHEGGHGIYEQNIDTKYDGTPVANGTSMGIHESQSRFFENVLGRSEALWQYLYPTVQKAFPEQLGDVTAEEFYLGINNAKASLIRVEADELTYSLHIMIRYEIEKGLFEGSIDMDRLPEIWNAKYEEYLGITPPSDADGVLQDVHWSDGLIGYFPSYALGNAYASQFVHKMEEELDLDALMAEGNYQPICDWLKREIHQFGSTQSPKEIIERVTGEPLNAKYFTDYLKKKFEKIYF